MVHLVSFAPLALAQVFLFIARARALSWSSSPFDSPALPIAVRSPYLNSWLAQGGSASSVTGIWFNTMQGDHITGWMGMIVVDGEGYRLFGAASYDGLTGATLSSVEFTATRTTFVYTAGSMTVNASFISPIEPTDLQRQSMPFTYLALSAESNDGITHDVRMYADITGEFLSTDWDAVATWDSYDDGDHLVLNMTLVDQTPFGELQNFAQDAVVVHSVNQVDGVSATWQVSYSDYLRGNATDMSITLNNTMDSGTRGIGQTWPVLAYMLDWGNITSTSQPAIFSVGLFRSPAVQYKSLAGKTQYRYPYFIATYADSTSAAVAFMEDYDRASSASSQFDEALSAAASTISSDYADVLALATRQAFGTLEITISADGSGNYNVSDVLVFCKNFGLFGSDLAGKTNSINSVDAVYAIYPMLLYYNPELAGYLLQPLLDVMDTEEYTLSYSAKNIGSTYPNATGDGMNTGHAYGIEETSAMIVMTLAYSQRSGNGTFISKHYGMLQGWANYLVENAMYPNAQATVDGVQSMNNQTNLALKGILGIAAMAKMSEIAGVDSDQESYNNTASDYLSEWQSTSIASGNEYVDIYYNDDGSNGLIYNLFADKLLQLDVVSTSVYDAASTYYSAASAQTSYGIATSSDNSSSTSLYAMMLAAAATSSSSVQNQLITLVRSYAAGGTNDSIFPLLYDPSTGDSLGGVGSPAVGSLYSVLALNTTIKDINIPSLGSTIPGSSGSSGGISKAAIAGGIIGAVAIAAVACAGIWWLLRRRRRQHEKFLSHAEAKPLPGAGQSASSIHKIVTPVDIYANTPHDVKVDPFMVDQQLVPTHINDRGVANITGVPRSAIVSSPSVRRQPGTEYGGTQIFFGASELQFSSSGVPVPRTVVPPSSAGSMELAMIEQNARLESEMRDQIQNLRRDVEQIRAEASMTTSPMYMPMPEPPSPRSEAPPQYFSLGGSVVGSSTSGNTRRWGSYSMASLMSGARTSNFDNGSDTFAENTMVRPNRRKN